MSYISKTAILFALFTATVYADMFTLTDLGPVSVSGINDSGQVVGTQGARAFLYSGGSMIDLGPGGAYAINNSGQVVGSSPPGRPFLYSDGSMIDLGFVGIAYGINDSGQIVGQTSDWHGFLYSGGSFTDLGEMFGNGAAASDINNSGQIVGQGPNGEAYLYSGGSMKDVGIPGSAESVATAINNSGQVVGVSWTGSAYIAFLYSGGSSMNLGTFTGIKSCFAHDINDASQIVGSCHLNPPGPIPPPGTPIYGAFLYSDGVMIGLNSLVVNGGGWSLSDASAINNRGQIVGSGTFNGENRAFLLTPVADVPEPSTFALAGVGLAAAVLLSRRRAALEGSR